MSINLEYFIFLTLELLFLFLRKISDHYSLIHIEINDTDIANGFGLTLGVATRPLQATDGHLLVHTEHDNLNAALEHHLLLLRVGSVGTILQFYSVGTRVIFYG